MRISFWINDTDAFPCSFAAHHIVAIEVVLYRNGAGEHVHDVIVHANGTKFRYPFTGRNISAQTDWEIWVEGQK